MSVLGTAFSIGSLAFLGGSLINPLLNKKVYGDVEDDWQNKEIDFDHIDNDNKTVVCKSGLLIRVYEIKGEAYDTKPFESQKILSKGRAILIHEMAKLEITARFFGIKRSKDVSFSANWQTPALKEIGEEETKTFKNSYEIRWFMVLQAKSLRHLEDINEKIYSIFKPYKPKLLKSPEDRNKPCPITCFLDYLCCGELRDNLTATSTNISGNLQSADLIFSKSAGTMIAQTPLPYIYKMINVSLWSETVAGSIFHQMMKVKGEFEIAQILKPLNGQKTSLSATRKAREVRTTPLGNQALGEECIYAVTAISEGSTSFFETQLSVTVRARTEEELNKVIEDLTSVFSEWHIKYSIETKAMLRTYFNRLPGNDRIVRSLKLKNDDIASLWSFIYSPVGLIKSYWSETPIRSFRTASGQSYAFQFQTTSANKALGNFCVFAPSGVGKSTLIMHLFGGLSKIPNFKSFIFDSKEGARFMIEAFGGVYQSYDKLALNPLDAPADDLSTKQNIAKMVKTMIGEIPKDEDIEELVNHLVSMAFQIPLGQRTFDALFDLAFPRQTEAKQSFAKWVTNNKGSKGFYSHIFNAPRDSLADFLGKSFMVGINMNEALEDDVLGASVVTHISTAIERIAKYGDLKGFAIFIDEAANLLRNQTFKSHTMTLYREYRKMGGAVGMAFQDPSALFKSGVADAVIENSSCFFFFPNPQGNREAYKDFNLNEEQLEFIYSGGIEGRRVLLVKRDAGTGFEESVILDVDLSNLGNSLRFYQSGHDAVKKLENLKNRWGEKWLENLK